MNEETKLPPFIVSYEQDGFCFHLNSGNPVMGQIARDFCIAQVGESEIDKYIVAAFWILEGYLYDFQMQDTSEAYPSLSYYMANRGNLDLPSLWKEWLRVIDTQEIAIIISAFVATRRNKFETLANVSGEEKKSASSKKPKAMPIVQEKAG